MTLGGVNAAGELISKSVKKKAAVYFGMSIDKSLADGVKLTLIATGLKTQGPRLSLRNRVRGLIPGSKSSDLGGFHGIESPPL